MAAALYPSRTDPGPAVPNPFQTVLMTELDFRDTRYPSISPAQTRPTQRAATAPVAVEPAVGSSDKTSGFQSTEERAATASSPTALDNPNRPQSRAAASDLQSVQSQPLSQSPEPARSTISYSLPPTSSRRVVERYSLDENAQQQLQLSTGTEDLMPPGLLTGQDQPRNIIVESPIRQSLSPDIMPSVSPSSPRHPSLPAAGIGANNSSGFPPPIVPSSASPSYVAPVSPRLRAYPQQPTYVSQSTVPNAINPVYSTAPPQPAEEVCVECAMRDQDMADVDVTSPGIWERESDVLFEELKRREEEDTANGVINDDPGRPRAKGGRLTEQNIKIWLSVNPREPASRQQTLYNYIKSQRTLLEAEALAHARAAQEARQLDNKMRDTYSRLRMSAYDTGNSATSADDTGGVRIKPPRSPSSPSMHERSHSRDVTLLENGMIVEHVDVRKEEKDARERRRKEERRMRKSSRGSGIDVTSLMSTQSLTPLTDSGVGLRPYSHYSYPSSGGGRPGSVFNDRPEIPRAHSQASFSDMHSLGSASPRRSRFLGIGNFRDRWRSQDSLAPSGMSGSMVDMHVALQREAHLNYGTVNGDYSTLRQSQVWPSTAPLEPTESRQSRMSEKTKKKKKGLAKIWGMVKGKRDSGKAEDDEPRSQEKQEDDLPLAPPPPLSYLVNGRSGRHTSTPSLISPKMGSSPGMSPPSAASSILPSPSTSSRPSNVDVDFSIRVRNGGGNYDDTDNDEDTIGKSQGFLQKNVVHPVTSEPDMRYRWEKTQPLPNVTNLPASREKSLPPLPGEAAWTPPTDPRPRTAYSFDTQGQPPPGIAPPHDFLPPQAAFRAGDVRRQSFGGLTSRPNLDSVMGQQGYNQGNASFGPQYEELGYSRRSLHMVQERPMTPTKRKSRFNISSLLGKKSTQPLAEPAAHPFPTTRHSGSDTPEEVLTNGYATSNSRHSAFSQTPRMSVTSRKALEELVAQDPEFVAYRYPSNDQRIDLR